MYCKWSLHVNYPQTKGLDMRVQLKTFTLLIVLSVVVWTANADEDDIYRDCGESIECSEGKLKTIIDRIDDEPKVEILDGALVLEKKDDGGAVQERANEDVFDRLMRFMTSHELKIGIPESEGRNIEPRRRKKLRRFLLPLLLVLKLKAAIIIPALLSLIALVSFKGLGASIVALSIAGATALKVLLESHTPKVSYEVIPQIHAPIWNRAGIENYPLGPGYHTI